MDQFYDAEPGIELLFARLAEGVQSAGSDLAQLNQLKGRFAEALGVVAGAANPSWLDSAKVTQGLLELACSQNGAEGPLDAAIPLNELTELVTRLLNALGPALGGDPEAEQALREHCGFAQSRWGELLDLVTESAADPVVPPLGTDPESPLTEVDQKQVCAILQTLEALPDGSTEADSPPPPHPAAGPPDAAPSTFPLPPQLEEVDLDEVLLDALMDDANHCLARMERIALDAQKQSPAELSESSRLVRRELHTLKGASASVDLKSLADYLHEVETWLEDPAHSSSLESLRDCVLTCVDVVRRHVARLQSDSAEDRVPGADSGGPERLNGATRFDDAADSGEGTLRVKTAQLDRLMDLLAQLAMLRSRRDSRAGELQRVLDQLTHVFERLSAASEEVSIAAPAGKITAAGSSEGIGPSHVVTFEAGSGLRSKLAELVGDMAEALKALRHLHEPLVEENRSISHFVGEFRQEIVQMRRLPLSGLFRRLQRAAFDAARAEGKQVQFELRGDHAGLERSLQERLFEPLLHMVRNAVSHGIESAADRLKAGKAEAGTVTLEAYGSSHVLVLEVTDDGRGLDYDAIRRRGLQRGLIAADRPVSDQELARLIFHPGFSTKEFSTGVSGRGVGMDIVASTLERLHCLLEVESQPGAGTRFRMTLPLYSIIEHVMVFRVADRLFGLPMTFVKSAGNVNDDRTPGKAAPVIRAAELLELGHEENGGTGRKLVIGFQRSISQHRSAKLSGLQTGQDVRDITLLVDEIVGPEEIVVRSLPSLLKDHPYLSGVTVSGRGEVLQLLDCHRLIKHFRSMKSQSARPAPAEPPTAGADRSDAPRPQPPGGAPAARKVLVADDSMSARRRLTEKLSRFGFDVIEAGDGVEALEKLRQEQFELLLTDLEMDRMSGFELLAELQQANLGNPRHAVMVTSRYDPGVREKCRQLGGTACLPKPISDKVLTDILSRMRLIEI